MKRRFLVYLHCYSASAVLALVITQKQDESETRWLCEAVLHVITFTKGSGIHPVEIASVFSRNFSGSTVGALGE